MWKKMYHKKGANTRFIFCKIILKEIRAHLDINISERENLKQFVKQNFFKVLKKSRWLVDFES